MQIISVLALFILYSCSNPVLSTPTATDGSSSGGTTPADNGVTVDPAQGIVAGFDFNDNIDANSPAQIVGGAQWVDGISGQALEFTQDGQYVFLPDSNSLDLSTAGTVEAWVYPYQNIIGAGIVHKGVATDFSDEAYTMQYWMPGQPSFGITSESGTFVNVIDTTALSLNQWHHIVGTWDSTECLLSLYVDGALVKQKTLPADFVVRNSSGGLIIGQQIPDPSASYGDYPFNGRIDNVTILNRALTASEVSARYSALAP
jgi:hypothetical protein